MDPSPAADTAPLPAPAPASAAQPAPRRSRAKYKSTYNTEALARALHAVTKDGMSLRKAAALFGVPKTTLADKIGEPLDRPLPKKTTRPKRSAWGDKELGEAATAVGAAGHGRAPEAPKNSTVRLTLAEERFIAAWALALMQLDVPPSKDEIYALASKVVRKRGGKGLGRQWVSHWLRKYPAIKALDWEAKQAAKKSGAPASDASAPERDDSGNRDVNPFDGEFDDRIDEQLDDQGDDQGDDQDANPGAADLEMIDGQM